MPTKTISIDLEAYAQLDRARIDPRESFSRVIRRATWSEAKRTCGSLLDDVKMLKPLPRTVLKQLEDAQRKDVPPRSRWQNG